jgi:predicted metal-binding membrane protein
VRTGAVALPRTAWPGAAASVLGAALLAWVVMVRQMSAMEMSVPGRAPSLAEAASFTGQWGVMMAAMMLPGAAPMILLYRTVSRRLAGAGDRVLPAPLFAAVYLLLWLVAGVPVYGAYVAMGWMAGRWPAFHAATPYAVAAVLAAAGAYQFTAAKRACLRQCESPMEFLMRRWRSGYAATVGLAARHGAYCIGCCWGLMAILVAGGAMSLPWVAGITLVVFAEKVLPNAWWTARAVGAALLLLALAVALRPELAGTLRGHDAHEMAHPISHRDTEAQR